MRWMQYSARLIAFIGMAALSFVCVASLSHGQDSGVSKDWKDIYILPTNRNPQSNIKVTLTADRTVAKPGDDLNLTFSADKECYLTLMDLGTSGRIVRLWPNDYSGQDNRIQPNVPRNFPGPGDNFRFKIGGPDGAERLIAYATSEKGRILSEQEFQQLQSTGFQQYIGGAKDLAFNFQKAAESLAKNVSWGTAQVNVCIGSGPPPSIGTTPASKVYLLSIAGHGKFDGRPEDNSAERIVEVLESKSKIEKSNIRVLKEPHSDYTGVSSGFQWLASSTQPEDTAIIYFTGHGDTDKNGEGLILLYPGKKAGETKEECLRKKHCLGKKEFGDFVNKIPARKKILIVDSCHARAITKAVITDYGELIPNYLVWPDSDEEEAPTRDKSGPPNYGNDHEALLAACRKEEVSYSVARLKGAVFSYFLIETIKHGCSNLEEAFYQTKRKTAEYYSKNPKIKIPPTPCLVDPHGLAKDFTFRN